MLQGVTDKNELVAVSVTDEGLLKVKVEEGGTAQVTRRPQLFNSSGAGTVAAGSNSVSFENLGNNDGVVLGSSLPSGCSVSFSASNNDVIGAIDYDATGTNFLISVLI